MENFECSPYISASTPSCWMHFDLLMDLARQIPTISNHTLTPPPTSVFGFAGHTAHPHPPAGGLASSAHPWTGEALDEDRRVSLAEWRLRHRGLAGSPFVALHAVSGEEGAAVEETFARMDADGRGAVLLSEFCGFVKHAEISAGTPVGRLLHLGD